MECAICLDVMHSGTTEFKCTHTFHNACLAKWHGTCPVCRARRCPFAQFKTEDKLICTNFGISCGDVLYITFHSVELEIRGTFKHIHRCGNNGTRNIYLHLQNVQLIDDKNTDKRCTEEKHTSPLQYYFNVKINEDTCDIRSLYVIKKAPVLHEPRPVRHETLDNSEQVGI